MAEVRGMEWAQLVSELDLVLYTFEEDQILILQQRGTGRYVQLFVSEPESLHLEVSSNAFLAPESALSEQDAVALMDLGWKPPRGKTPNYWADLKGPDATAQAAVLTVRTLAEVLGAAFPSELEYDAFQATGEAMTLPPLKLRRMKREEARPA